MIMMDVVQRIVTMTDKVKNTVADLTIDELKALIREILREMVDPDALLDPPLSPEFAERLRRYQQEKPKGIPVDEVVKRLGLDAWR